MLVRNRKVSRSSGVTQLAITGLGFIPAAGAVQVQAAAFPNGEMHPYQIRSNISFTPSDDVIGSRLAQSLSCSFFQGESLDENAMDSSFGGRYNTTLTYLDGTAILSSANSLKRSKMPLDAGVPLLIKIDPNQFEVGKKVAALFGVSIRSGYIRLNKDGPEKLNVFNLQAPGKMEIPNGPMQAMGSMKQQNDLSPHCMDKQIREEDPVGIPKITLNLNSADVTGQVVSIVNLDLIRSGSRNSDKKIVIIKATPTVRSTRKGVAIGSAPSNNLWGTYLPHQYSIFHEVNRPGF